MSKILFGRSTTASEYSLVVLRVIIALFWLNSDVPRWNAIAGGQTLSNGIVQGLFGAGMVVPLTVFFTLLETLGAIALLLGLFTRLGAFWGVVEFAITGSFGLTHGVPGLLKDFGLFGGSIVLLLSGSPRLSLDELIAKRKTH